MPRPCPVVPRRRTALLLIASLMAAFASAPFAGAVVPEPQADSSVVTVKVGGDRTGTRTVAPLAGVELALFAQADDADPVAETWATCTSDADGDCSFVVPDTAAGGANAGAQFWVEQVSAPTGWFMNRSLRTGAGSGSGSVDNPYRFQTPALAAGSTYSSQSSFMFGSAVSGRQEDSEGVWQDSRTNPTLPAGCGLDVAVVMDLSSSVGTSLRGLKGAADTFIDALVGSPSRVALFSFDGASPSAGADANHPALRSVATPAGAEDVKSTYADWTLGSGTNWDQGLWAVAQASQSYELVVVITDGNPTRFSADPLLGSGGTTHFRDVENGIYSANAVKAKGSRVLAVGVGRGLDQISRLNLLALSGQTLYDGSNVEDADYYDADSYRQAGAALRQLALSKCGGRVAVFKQVVPPGAAGEDVTGAEPAGPGWAFDASTTTAGAGGLPAEQTTVDDGTGAVYFDVDLPSGTASADMTIAEQQQPGYDIVPQGGDNATCLDRTNNDTPLAVDNAGDPASPGFTMDVPAGSFVVCTVYNRASASIEVDKRWVVDGVGYAQGDQPAGIDAALTLTAPGGQASTAQPWSVTRHGYAAEEAVTVAETTTLPSTCGLTSARVSQVDGETEDAAVPFDTTAGFPTRHVVVTNHVDCTTTLTLRKQVVNDDDGTARPDEWTLTADGRTALSGASGEDEVTGAEVEPGEYLLAESDGPDGYDQIGWDCVGQGDELPVTEDRVTVAPGADVVCTVTNDDRRGTTGGTVPGHHTGNTGGGGDLADTGMPVRTSWLVLGLVLLLGGGALVVSARRSTE